MSYGELSVPIIMPINIVKVYKILQGKATVKMAIDTFGKIDIVINNAGILRDTIFHKMEPSDWESVINVHLNGGFYVSRAAAPYFREQNSGSYVHMTSTSGLIGNFNLLRFFCCLSASDTNSFILVHILPNGLLLQSLPDAHPR